MTLCQYNSNGYKVSEWWMFLFLLYIASLMVGVVFVVAGFTSSDYGMGAVGLVLCIAGACLAVVCDLLRRFGCGWKKVLASRSTRFGDNSQENSEVDSHFPYLPRYPGFSTTAVDTCADNPPPYAICSGEPYTTSSDISCSCGESYACLDNRRLESSHSTDRIPEATCTTLSVTENLPRDHEPSSFVLDQVAGREPRTLKPSPPPYDFVVVTTFDASRLSWLRDSPPPYAEFV